QIPSAAPRQSALLPCPLHPSLRLHPADQRPQESIPPPLPRRLLALAHLGAASHRARDHDAALASAASHAAGPEPARHARRPGRRLRQRGHAQDRHARPARRRSARARRP
ncbi:hypothetical protein LTR16_010495, partial [Cryomyces antarcticus]